ncbi:hypothetical protein EDEG_02753 [Edhazardia aedis USNM 41457]|uniref:Uncharacterized protein n=1 Tax=Edhazardia aedis (strain USNM 41457) TaxID=1003232 RepID=J8ZT72_EDHAE|nr:hypothetical protein EDEG_02753 [Edhazardia aedis USNM 41457]|eukprot:EJW02873.1 hypothetical protein EDEG_02753 [Edhazardia aedis USNM 41457]
MLFLKFWMLLHLSFSRQEEEKKTYDGIVCYNINNEYPEGHFFELISRHISQISLHIFTQEKHNRKSFIMGLEDSFYKCVTTLIYKNILLFHAKTIIDNLDTLIFSDTKSPLNNATEILEINIPTNFQFCENIGSLSKVIFDPFYDFLSYEIFLQMYLENHTFRKDFNIGLKTTLDILITKKFDSNKFIGKTFVDNIRLYLTDLKYQILTDSIGKTLSIFYNHSSIYTNETEFSAFINYSISKYKTRSNVNGEIPKIFHKCCTDLLFAEILSNLYMIYIGKFKKNKTIVNNYKKIIKNNMNLFLDGKISLKNEINAYKNEYDADDMKGIASIFFRPKWSENDKYQTKIRHNSVNNNKLGISCDFKAKNSIKFKKLYNIASNNLEKLKKFGFYWTDMIKKEIISMYIKSKTGDGTIILICFEFFNIKNVDENENNYQKKSIFIKRMNELKEHICVDINENEFDYLVEQYKTEYLIKISLIIMSHYKAALRKIYPKCIIIETIPEQLPNFQLFCILG